MEIDRILNDILNYIHTNQAGSIAAGVILLYLLIKKPKIFFIVIVLGILGIGFMQVYDKLASSGITDKDFGSLKELK